MSTCPFGNTAAFLMNQTRFTNRIQFLVEFAYVGSAFHGVQEQPGLKTVLGTLRTHLQDASLQKACALYGAARTDRGVSALHNMATFYLKSLPNINGFISHVLKTQYAGLYITSLKPVLPTVHARGISLGKIYRYSIKDECEPSTIIHPFAWEITPALSIDDMKKAALLLVGERDFSSLRGGGCQAGSSIKEIFKIDIIKNNRGYIFIDIHGNGFLRKMIRNIIGLLVEIGVGLRAPESIPPILAEKNRTAAGITAPAHALCLMRVLYRPV